MKMFSMYLYNTNGFGIKIIYDYYIAINALQPLEGLKCESK